jgi:uncharacterized membrane protein
MNARSAYVGACLSLLALIFLCLAWELKLAPITTGGSWLALKCLPLLLPLRGILKAHRYTYQWTSMLILLYLTEGIVRATSDRGLSQWLAGVEIALALVFFAATIGFVRATRHQGQTNRTG